MFRRQGLVDGMQAEVLLANFVAQAVQSGGVDLSGSESAFISSIRVISIDGIDVLLDEPDDCLSSFFCADAASDISSTAVFANNAFLLLLRVVETRSPFGYRGVESHEKGYIVVLGLGDG